MPIPNEQAGPDSAEPSDPLKRLWDDVAEIANMRCRGEIDEETWEELIQQALRDNNVK